MANCAVHRDVKHGGWCVPCLLAELEGIYEAARRPGDAALFDAVKKSEARVQLEAPCR